MSGSSEHPQRRLQQQWLPGGAVSPLRLLLLVAVGVIVTVSAAPVEIGIPCSVAGVITVPRSMDVSALLAVTVPQDGASGTRQLLLPNQTLRYTISGCHSPRHPLQRVVITRSTAFAALVVIQLVLRDSCLAGVSVNGDAAEGMPRLMVTLVNSSAPLSTSSHVVDVDVAVLQDGNLPPSSSCARATVSTALPFPGGATSISNSSFLLRGLMLDEGGLRLASLRLSHTAIVVDNCTLIGERIALDVSDVTLEQGSSLLVARSRLISSWLICMGPSSATATMYTIALRNVRIVITSGGDNDDSKPMIPAYDGGEAAGLMGGTYQTDKEGGGSGGWLLPSAVTYGAIAIMTSRVVGEGSYGSIFSGPERCTVIAILLEKVSFLTCDDNTRTTMGTTAGNGSSQMKPPPWLLISDVVVSVSGLIVGQSQSVHALVIDGASSSFPAYPAVSGGLAHNGADDDEAQQQPIALLRNVTFHTFGRGHLIIIRDSELRGFAIQNAKRLDEPAAYALFVDMSGTGPSSAVVALTNVVLWDVRLGEEEGGEGRGFPFAMEWSNVTVHAGSIHTSTSFGGFSMVKSTLLNVDMVVDHAQLNGMPIVLDRTVLVDSQIQWRYAHHPAEVRLQQSTFTRSRLLFYRLLLQRQDVSWNSPLAGVTVVLCRFQASSTALMFVESTLDYRVRNCFHPQSTGLALPIHGMWIDRTSLIGDGDDDETTQVNVDATTLGATRSGALLLLDNTAPPLLQLCNVNITVFGSPDQLYSGSNRCAVHGIRFSDVKMRNGARLILSGHGGEGGTAAPGGRGNDTSRATRIIVQGLDTQSTSVYGVWFEQLDNDVQAQPTSTLTTTTTTPLSSSWSARQSSILITDVEFVMRSASPSAMVMSQSTVRRFILHRVSSSSFAVLSLDTTSMRDAVIQAWMGPMKDVSLRNCWIDHDALSPVVVAVSTPTAGAGAILLLQNVTMADYSRITFSGVVTDNALNDLTFKDVRILSSSVLLLSRSFFHAEVTAASPEVSLLFMRDVSILGEGSAMAIMDTTISLEKTNCMGQNAIDPHEVRAVDVVGVQLEDGAGMYLCNVTVIAAGSYSHLYSGPNRCAVFGVSLRRINITRQSVLLLEGLVPRVTGLKDTTAVRNVSVGSGADAVLVDATSAFTATIVGGGTVSLPNLEASIPPIVTPSATSIAEATPPPHGTCGALRKALLLLPTAAGGVSCSNAASLGATFASWVSDVLLCNDAGASRMIMTCPVDLTSPPRRDSFTVSPTITQKRSESEHTASATRTVRPAAHPPLPSPQESPSLLTSQPTTVYPLRRTLTASATKVPAVGGIGGDHLRLARTRSRSREAKFNLSSVPPEEKQRVEAAKAAATTSATAAGATLAVVSAIAGPSSGAASTTATSLGRVLQMLDCTLTVGSPDGGHVDVEDVSFVWARGRGMQPSAAIALGSTLTVILFSTAVASRLPTSEVAKAVLATVLMYYGPNTVGLAARVLSTETPPSVGGDEMSTSVSLSIAGLALGCVWLTIAAMGRCIAMATWTPATTDPSSRLRALDALVDGARQPELSAARRLHAIVDVTVATAGAVLSGVRYRRASTCAVGALSIVALVAVQVVYVVRVRPFLCPRDYLWAAANGASLSIVATLAGASMLATTYSTPLVLATSYASAAATVVLYVQAVVEGVVAIRRWWANHHGQQRSSDPVGGAAEGEGTQLDESPPPIDPSFDMPLLMTIPTDRSGVKPTRPAVGKNPLEAF